MLSVTHGDLETLLERDMLLLRDRDLDMLIDLEAERDLERVRERPRSSSAILSTVHEIGVQCFDESVELRKGKRYDRQAKSIRRTVIEVCGWSRRPCTRHSLLHARIAFVSWFHSDLRQHRSVFAATVIQGSSPAQLLIRPGADV